MKKVTMMLAALVIFAGTVLDITEPGPGDTIPAISMSTPARA